MNSKTMKLCAIAVVAFFVATAFVIIPADGSDAADDSSKTYYIHFEEANSAIETVKSTWLEFKAADGTFESFRSMANVAFANYNIDEAVSEAGWFTGYGGWNTTWILKEGKWTAVEDGKTDYVSTDTIAIIAGPGCSSTVEPAAAVKDKFWYNESAGYWMHIPSVAVDDYKSDSHKTYNLHFEIVNAATDVNSAQSTWISFDATDSTQASFVGAANSAFKLYNIALDYAMDGSLSGFSGNITAWVLKDGAWTLVTDTSTEYAATDVIALVVGPGCYIYGSEPAAAVKDKYWYNEAWGMYQRLPCVGVDDYKNASKTYNVVYENVADDCSIDKIVKMEFDATDKDNAAFAAALNKAFVENGLDITITNTGSYFSIASATFGKKFSTWFTTDGGEWKYTTDTLTEYISAEAIALEGGKKSYFYNAEPPADVKDKYWFEEAFNMWHRLPETASDFYKDEKKSNTMLYVGIGIGAVIVVAAVAFLFLRKK